uniref:pectinesterase n=1 Tax=Brassica oleracea var. oleracea TaxID=109376 RepID=A0A0D3E5N7_BRAOL
EKIVIPLEKQKIILQGNNPSEVIIQYNDAGQAHSCGPMLVNAEYFVAINVTFKKCVIYVKGMTRNKMVEGGAMLPGFITAQGRQSEQDTSGFVFKYCAIKGDGTAFLGRAYRGYSRVVFYATSMSNVIVPQGWDAWLNKGEEYLTHEKEYCLSVKEEPRVQLPTERTGVFARVQVPQGQNDRQPLLRSVSLRDREHDRQVDALTARHAGGQRARENRDRYQGSQVNQYRGHNNSKHDSHSDRVIRARDERPRSNRYGGSRFGAKPYDRFGMEEATWRVKAKEKRSDKGHLRWREKIKENGMVESSSMDVVPYEHTPYNKPHSISDDRPYRSKDQKSGGEHSGKRLASAIVTPSRQPHSMEDNVTVRCNLNHSLTFSPQGSANVIENDQMIGALNDMDLVEPFEGAMMECDDHADDLLGQDLMELEEKGQSSQVAESSRAKANTKETKRSKSGRAAWEKNLSATDVDFLVNPKTFIDRDSWIVTLPYSLVSLYSPSSIQ